MQCVFSVDSFSSPLVLYSRPERKKKDDNNKQHSTPVTNALVRVAFGSRWSSPSPARTKRRFPLIFFFLFSVYFILFTDDDVDKRDETHRDTVSECTQRLLQDSKENGAAAETTGKLFSVGCPSSGQLWARSSGSSRASSLACQSRERFDRSHAHARASRTRSYLKSGRLRHFLLLSFGLLRLLGGTANKPKRRVRARRSSAPRT